MQALIDEGRSLVTLFDVDNTLLDNDRVARDLARHLEETFGKERCDHYWTIFEELRAQLGYADYLGALQRYRVEHVHDPGLLGMSSFLIDYPFADRLYPDALDVIERARSWGAAVILSDGDVVFQPRKIERSGLSEALEGRVLIYIHKEKEIEEIARLYPADHYVLVDDKLRILAAFKQAWGRRVTTVFPRQGHYALDPDVLRSYPPADVTLDRIGDLLRFEPADLLAAGRGTTPVRET